MWQELETLIAVVEEQQFTRAASRLGVSQPEVSRRIRRLERRLGVVLLIRSTRHVVVTEQGRDVAEWARGLFESWELARRRIEEC
ncbi:LysR family transcriptional regulator [Actinoplanes sp. CA-030573]|uniref:LysR family transcriptional regulator n=1 Tax=Actinoplanes sp. CA-030573 TaxID=3239898 RepID=UPI003D8BBE12